MKPTKIAKISPASNKQWASRKLEFHSSENQKVSSEQKFQNFLESWVKFEWKTRVKLSDALTRQIPDFDHGCRPWLLTKKWSKSEKKLKKYQIRVHFHLTISGSSHEPKKLGPNSFYGQLSIWLRFDTSSILVFTVLSILPTAKIVF